MLRVAGVVLLAVVLGACKAAEVGQAPRSMAPMPAFGPVIGTEVIAGRADSGALVYLLAGGTDLVRIDLGARQADRTALALSPGESCWGLARLADGTLWSLKGRRMLSRLQTDGRIAENIALPAPHFGVFAAGDRLVYQEATFTSPGPALQIESHERGQRSPWSGITTRPFDKLARASAAVLNMVSCGATETDERACWFPDEPVVYLVTKDGMTRRVPLSGLAVVSPELLLTSDNPVRPVRDAYIDQAGDIWVLSTGTSPASAANTPGGWILARFSTDGVVKGQTRLLQAARLILRADPQRLTLLMSSGMVAEVRSW